VIIGSIEMLDMSDIVREAESKVRRCYVGERKMGGRR
jgi:hypothetical protein